MPAAKLFKDFKRNETMEDLRIGQIDALVVANWSTVQALGHHEVRPNVSDFHLQQNYALV